MAKDFNQLTLPEIKKKIKSRAGRIAELQAELKFLNNLYEKNMDSRMEALPQKPIPPKAPKNPKEAMKFQNEIQKEKGCIIKEVKYVKDVKDNRKA